MSELHAALEEYLAVRRALGFKLCSVERFLQRFVDFVEQQGATVITTKLALQWATQPAQAQPAHWAARLGMVRRFAQYRRALDSRTEVPPPDLLPFKVRRPAPYLYSDDEVRRLIRAASQLRSASGLRARTFVTLFSLFAVTGMRTSEPLQLDRDDVDLNHGVLTVRDTKFGKSRYVPMHASTQRALRGYVRHRDRLCALPQSPSFFISERGTRLTQWCLRWTFVKLSREIGLRGPGDSHGPRLLDFRHRFAVNTLIRWYRSGVDVERHLPELSTYLGHVHITDTYWYLSAVPELMHLAARRLERTARGGTR